MADLQALTRRLCEGEIGAFGRNDSQGGSSVILGQSSLEVSGGLILWVWLMGTPFHEEAVGEPSKQAHNPHALGVANAASVVVLGDIQTLVQTVFDTAKAGPV